jgi:hypothetical protein
MKEAATMATRDRRRCERRALRPLAIRDRRCVEQRVAASSDKCGAACFVPTLATPGAENAFALNILRVANNFMEMFHAPLRMEDIG